MTAAILVWSGFAAARGTTAATQSQATGTKGTVRGITTDTNDARIVGASLQFSGEGVTASAKSDRDGFYELKLEPGSYEIQVTATGFQRIHKEQFDIRPSPYVELNFHMTVASSGPMPIKPALPEPTSTRVATKLSDPSPVASKNSAYPPQYASVKTVPAWIPMRDGVRL